MSITADRVTPAGSESLASSTRGVRTSSETVTHSAPPETERRTILSDYREIVHDLAHGRDLLYQLTLRDIRIRYKQAVLGLAWALLMPLVIVCAGLAVRIAFAYVSGKPIDTLQLASIAVKAVPWAFFVGCISTSTPSLSSNITLVTKVYFAREVLPLGAVLAQTFDSTIGASVVLLLLPVFKVSPSWQLLWVPALAFMLWVFAFAVALFLSCANVFYRDVKYLVQVILSFGIFFTPVLVEAAMFGPKFAPIIMLNPVAPILEGLRLAIVDHHNLLTPMMGHGGFIIWHPWYLAYAAAWSFGGLLVSALLFHRAEHRFAEMV